MEKLVKHNWTSLALELGMEDYRTLKKNVKSIKPKLDEMVDGRTNYKSLTTAQVALIKKHLGYL